jgi:hypothetical protein
LLLARQGTNLKKKKIPAKEKKMVGTQENIAGEKHIYRSEN